MNADVSQIGSRQLYVGSFKGATKARDEFDYIVSLNANSVPADATDAQVHHIPLDGRAPDPDEFAEAVNSARRAYRASGRVLVHCAVGQNRSVTVAATALAAEDNISLDDAVYEIRQSRPQASPRDELLEVARAYLETR